MRTGVKVAASSFVLAALASGSVGFNRWIDQHEETEPGATALRVVAGTGYTLAGIVAIVAVWRGVQDALRCAAILLATFTATGLPMIVGDVNRDSW